MSSSADETHHRHCDLQTEASRSPVKVKSLSRLSLIDRYTRRDSYTTRALIADTVGDGVRASNAARSQDLDVERPVDVNRSQVGPDTMSCHAASSFHPNDHSLEFSRWQLSDTDGQDSEVSAFDGIFSRSLLSTVIDMYFDYVYCLVPFPHPPTFMIDYYGHREKRPLEDEWSAMVLAMAAFTISLVPHQILPGDKRSLRSLAVESCNLARNYLAKPFTQNTLQRCKFHHSR